MGPRRKQKDEAPRLGADAIVALDDDRELDTLPTLDAIADTVGGPTLAKLLPRVRRGGILATVVGKPAGADERGLVVHAIMTHPDSARLAALAQAVAERKLVIPIVRRFSLSEIRAAHQAAERGRRRQGPPGASEAASAVGVHRSAVAIDRSAALARAPLSRPSPTHPARRALRRCVTF